MKNSEIYRAAMPLIRTPDFGDGRWHGMCDAICIGVNAGYPDPILKILFCNDKEFEKTGAYFYPTLYSIYSTSKRKQGYTSRIIFLELAALMWEEAGK